MLPKKNPLEYKLENSNLNGIKARPRQYSEESSVNTPNIIYKDRFVAFVDLLGFRSIVMRTSRNSDKIANDEKTNTIQIVYEALKTITISDAKQLFIKEYSKSGVPSTEIMNADIDITGFSDTVILSCKDDECSFAVMSFMIFNIIRRFAIQGFYCRGGVKFGEVFIEDTKSNEGEKSVDNIAKERAKIIFGPAFIGAYDLEQKNAGDARVIFCNDSAKKIKKWRNGSSFVKFFETYFKQSKDGPWTLQAFHDINTMDPSDIENIKRKLEDVLEQYTESPAVFRKLAYVAREFNDALSVKNQKSYKINLP